MAFITFASSLEHHKTRQRNSCVKETLGRCLCVVDVAETQFHNLDELNMPRFFPTLTNFTKIAFSCRMLTQKASWPPNYTTLTSSVNENLKAMTDMVFWTKFSCGQIFFIYIGTFFLNNREYSRVDWLDTLIIQNIGFLPKNMSLEVFILGASQTTLWIWILLQGAELCAVC